MNYMDIPIGTVIPFFFDTFAGATGASITMSAFSPGDVKIFKNGLTAKPTTTAGVALLGTGMDAAGEGIHAFSIDTGNVTDVGYFAIGSYYNVVIDSITVDAQTVRFYAGAFRLLPAETQVGYRKVDAQYVAGAAPETGNNFADSLLDRTDGVETGRTPRMALRAIAAASAGVVAGAGTSAITIAALGNPATNRITTVGSDVDGNRPTVALNL